MEYHHLQSPWSGGGYLNVSISRTVMVTVSQDCEGDNSDAYIRTVTEFTKLFKQVQLQDCDRLRTPSQNLVGHCYSIHLTAPSSMLKF
jgi:hypothetical protein